MRGNGGEEKKILGNDEKAVTEGWKDHSKLRLNYALEKVGAIKILTG